MVNMVDLHQVCMGLIVGWVNTWEKSIIVQNGKDVNGVTQDVGLKQRLCRQ